MALIDRGRVMTDYLENLGKKDSYKAKYEALVKAVDDAPTIDAEPVRHGRWEQYPGHGSIRCMRCKLEFDEQKMPSARDYCPNCGAKMDAEIQYD